MISPWLTFMACLFQHRMPIKYQSGFDMEMVLALIKKCSLNTRKGVQWFQKFFCSWFLVRIKLHGANQWKNWVFSEEYHRSRSVINCLTASVKENKIAEICPYFFLEHLRQLYLGKLILTEQDIRIFQFKQRGQL